MQMARPRLQENASKVNVEVPQQKALVISFASLGQRQSHATGWARVLPRHQGHVIGLEFSLGYNSKDLFSFPFFSSARRREEGMGK